MTEQNGDHLLDLLLDLRIIVIGNIHTAPNPTSLAQSTLQFKTRMNITIKT